jgi:hypothetical protein
VSLRTNRIIWSPKLFRTDSAMGGRTQAGMGECSYMSKCQKEKKKKKQRGKWYEGWEKKEISSPED